jgi:hypothetical protein
MPFGDDTAAMNENEKPACGAAGVLSISGDSLLFTADAGEEYKVCHYDVRVVLLEDMSKMKAGTNLYVLRPGIDGSSPVGRIYGARNRRGRRSFVDYELPKSMRVMIDDKSAAFYENSGGKWLDYSYAAARLSRIRP